MLVKHSMLRSSSSGVTATSGSRTQHELRCTMHGPTCGGALPGLKAYLCMMAPAITQPGRATAGMCSISQTARHTGDLPRTWATASGSRIWSGRPLLAVESRTVAR